MLQVQLRQTPQTPEKLQGAREGQASGHNTSETQQSHDGDVIFKVPNTTDAQVRGPPCSMLRPALQQCW